MLSLNTLFVVQTCRFQYLINNTTDRIWYTEMYIWLLGDEHNQVGHPKNQNLAVITLYKRRQQQHALLRSL